MKRSSSYPEDQDTSPAKKKKRSKKEVQSADVDLHSESSTDETTTGRPYTVTVALPGSIISNAQSQELKTLLAGQVARAAVVFNVDEVVVFDEQGSTGKRPASGSKSQFCADPNIFLARVLQYLETPQYLRKALFPMHPDLKYGGLLSPLDCPHHMRQDDHAPYREGVVLDRPASKKSGSYVDCGMRKNVQVDKRLKPGLRVTVAIQQTNSTGVKHHRGAVVSPSTPRSVGGLYWGYNVRLAHSFGAVFTESPFEGGYDLTLGTSERGMDIDSFSSLPSFRHLLVVLGGVKGLEYSLECDESLQVTDVSLLFKHYLNVCPNQGSRTIRTEEALFIVMSALRPLITKSRQRTS